MSATDIIHLFTKHQLRVFTTGDLATLSNLRMDAASQALRRLQTKGLVLHIKRGVWVSTIAQNILPHEILPFLTAPWPAYVSLENALSEWGILTQIPSVLHGVTTGKGFSLKTSLGDFRLYHLQQKLFGHFLIQQTSGRNYPIAEPEKAILDTLYLRYRLNRKPNLSGWDITAINKTKLKLLSKHYPQAVRQMIQTLS